MKTLFALFACLFISGPVLADGTENLDNVRTQLCDYWKYDFNSSSYTCMILGSYVNLVEASKQNEIVVNLENRIAELEKRLKKLEEK